MLGYGKWGTDGDSSGTHWLPLEGQRRALSLPPEARRQPSQGKIDWGAQTAGSIDSNVQTPILLHSFIHWVLYIYFFVIFTVLWRSFIDVVIHYDLFLYWFIFPIFSTRAAFHTGWLVYSIIVYILMDMDHTMKDVAMLNRNPKFKNKSETSPGQQGHKIMEHKTKSQMLMTDQFIDKKLDHPRRTCD